MRSTPEWIGKTDDARPPNRVRVRVFVRYGGRCHCCDSSIYPGTIWQLDHIVPLINGGENRESNLAPIKTEHHKIKTKADVVQKALVYKKRKKHLGLHKSKNPLPGSRASAWKKKMSGKWERR